MDSANRLRRHADYQALYKNGRKHFAKHMSYFVSPRSCADGEGVRAFGEEIAGPRVGLTVGKVLGKAVDRNRIKRRLRAAVRQHIGLLDGLDVDIALHPRKVVLDLDWSVLEEEVAFIFRAIAKMQEKKTTGTV
ncbi:MAG: ribonuclease P protein component [Acidobacteria bacterium]|nr:ribonuclease P protein component [Acidobacteriota bacterium]